MLKTYFLPVWLLLLALLGVGLPAAQAQSGPYGNEWIVPGQPYYKLKTWRDGIYRLDYAYLSQLAGASGVAPSQLQLWRRGKEVAVYQGGNVATLDASSFLEFYGQRNDGALDKEYYKNPALQANPYYSYFTDTASYFITWGSRAGKRMAQPTATAGTPHAWRLQNNLKLHVDAYADEPINFYTYLPWLEGGDGFFSYDNLGLIFSNNAPLVARNDTALRAVATSASTPPRLEVVFKGNSDPAAGHNITLSVVQPDGTVRAIGNFQFRDYLVRRGRYALPFSDIDANGQVTVSLRGVQPPTPVFSTYQYAYTRLVVPQQVLWFSNRRQVFFQNDSLLAGPATYDVPSVPATVAGFDVHDPWNVQRIVPGAAATSGAARFVFPSATTAQTRNLLLADEARPMTPSPARRVSFRTINPAAATFVVVTHPKLQKPFGSSQNPARDYAAYRASAAGGRYDTLMVTSPLLYDQFFYGERSALALRHFARWLAASTPATQARYLLLLGKGITTGSDLGNNDYHNSYRGVSAASTTRVQGEVGLDLVPTTSRSPSDVFFSNDWPNGDYMPRLITGRVIASTPEECVNYLDKLKAYEAALTAPTLDAWHKSVLNLVGGVTTQDFAEFGGYLDRYKFQMEHPLYGASVKTIRRTTTSTSLPVPLNISSDVNQGLQFINYFGHGSPTDINFDLGDINDPSSGYANVGKYPIMIMNGCAVGACFFAGRTFGGDWLLAPKKGTVGLLSETGFSYAYLINPEQDTTNKLLFNTPAWFGRPVAEVHREVIRRLQNTAYYPASDAAATAQLLCNIWHGDPALRIFAPAKPDFITSNNDLSISSPAGLNVPVTASSGSFVLNVGVSNPARITRDSVEIRVTRSYTSATSGTAQKAVYLYYRRTGSTLTAFPQAFRRDTTYALTLPPITDATGDNTFLVELDFRNRVSELSETNNSGTLRFSFLRSGITLLAPREFAVVNTTSPRLVAQSNNLNEAQRGYDVQIDSVSTFGSPALQSFARQATTVLSLTPPRALAPASGRDSVVWYWRVRFTTPATGEDGSWVAGSFRVINGAVAGGWSQSHNGQFGRDQLSGVAVAAPSNRWSFAPVGQAVLLRTSGGGLPGSGPTFPASGTILTNLSQAPYLANCGDALPGMLAVVLDGTTLRRVAVPAPAGTSYTVCGTNGQTFYLFAKPTGDPRDSTNTTINNSADYRAQLSTFLDNVPDGAYVLLVSQNRVRFASPDLAALRQKLTTLLGSTLLSQLRNGEPWAIVARKRASGGTLVAEQGPDRSSATPAYSQTITLNTSVTRPGTSGTITSTTIGPALEWQSLFNQIQNPNATGSYTLALLGVDASGSETVLNPNITTKTLSLRNISAATYPNLRLRLTLADTTARVPPQLRQWLLAYKGKPEGVVRRDLVNPAAYDAALLTSQARSPGYLSFPLKFDNVAPDPFTGRLKVQLTLYDANNNVAKYPDGSAVQTLITAPRDLGANDSVLTIPASLLKLKVIGVFGTLTPEAVVNPQIPAAELPEQYHFNNVLRLPPITVNDTNVPPTIDVAVDGRHILNGELVSPTPTIVIQLKDEDRLRFINKPDYLTVYLQKDGQGTPTRVTDPSLLRFTVDSTSQVGSVARLEYTPGKNTVLENGVYTLSVQGRDPSNAQAGTQQFTVKFEVVKESTITNVFPYPNPVTSKAKFVFTVTGTALPRNMKIQIMTLTGRVVREIFMGELGPLHIGNNITDYAWDGTDQYGDRLANGTYLYRVLLDDDGQFQRRETAGDRAFKNDWGKLVLLR